MVRSIASACLPVEVGGLNLAAACCQISQELVGQIASQPAGRSVQQPVALIGQQVVAQLTKSPWINNITAAEYALSDIHKPIGVTEYKLTHSLPRKIQSGMPSIKEIEPGTGK